MPVIRYSQSLDRIVNRIISLDEFCIDSLSFGDLILISTVNSTYFVIVLDEDHYLVFGGWFDRKGLSPTKLGINGCTWGGNIIKIDIVAAFGLHMEFNNGLVTSKIQEVTVFKMIGRN
jgi:hypothetical protein